MSWWWFVLIVVGLAAAVPAYVLADEIRLDFIDRRQARNAPPEAPTEAKARLSVGEYTPPESVTFASEVPTEWLAPKVWADGAARAAEDLR